MTFHFADWLIGIGIPIMACFLIMAYYDPYMTGEYNNTLYTANNQGQLVTAPI